MKTAYVYCDELSRFDYGAAHPLKPERLRLAYELTRACGLLSPDDSRIVRPLPAAEEDLLTFHTREYIEVLKAANSGISPVGAGAFGLGPGDNPVFPGMFDWSRLVAGASLLAASLVGSGEADIAFSIGSGLHHAHPTRSSGFCYVNDAVLAIQSLVRKGGRVAYIDIDAHHGDGVQDAFFGTDRVLTVSIHETGTALFPGTGFEYETGTDEGAGYSVNIPLPPEADDGLFLNVFDRTVPALVEAFKPDFVVTQLGVDTFRTDPLSHLNCTTNGFCEAVRKLRDLAPRWIALGGGGYDLGNVARAWTLAWAIMNGVEAPLEMPLDFFEAHRGDFADTRLRDLSHVVDGLLEERLKKEVDRVIDFVRDRVLPSI
jgi:acetoin utilization protein AcuC